MSGAVSSARFQLHAAHTPSHASMRRTHDTPESGAAHMGPVLRLNGTAVHSFAKAAAVGRSIAQAGTALQAGLWRLRRYKQTYVRALANLGIAYANQEMYPTPRARARMLAHKRALAHARAHAQTRAHTHRRARRYAESSSCYLRALSLNPEAVHIWHSLRLSLTCWVGLRLPPSLAYAEPVLDWPAPPSSRSPCPAGGADRRSALRVAARSIARCAACLLFVCWGSVEIRSSVRRMRQPFADGAHAVADATGRLEMPCPHPVCRTTRAAASWSRSRTSAT
jgi:hypothetical protein